MPKKVRINLIGKKFGRLFVESYSHTRDKIAYWKCSCKCGGTKTTRGFHLKSGRTQSCGCLRKECTARRKPALTHGMRGTPVYDAWRMMLGRCNNIKHKDFPYYGKRGIKVCDHWRKFENFYADMRDKPSKIHSIDRINNDGNYEPVNCRWATPKEQANNKRNNKKFTHCCAP